MHSQYRIAFEHVKKGCLSDIPDVKYTWQDHKDITHVNRGSNLLETFHAQLNKTKKGSHFGVSILSILARATCHHWNASRFVLLARDMRNFRTNNILLLETCRRALEKVCGSPGVFADAYLPPNKEPPTAKFFNLYEYVHVVVSPAHTQGVLNESLAPILKAALARDPTVPTDLTMLTPLQVPRMFASKHGIIPAFPSNKIWVENQESDSAIDALLQGLRTATDQEFDISTFIHDLKTHVFDYREIYQNFMDADVDSFLAGAVKAFPMVDSSSQDDANSLFVSFILHAASNMFGIPFVLFKQHNEIVRFDVITPFIFVEGLRDYTTVILLAQAGLSSLKLCLFVNPIEVVPCGSSDLLSTAADKIPLPQQDSVQAPLVIRIDQIDLTGKKAPDNAAGGAMATHVVRTPANSCTMRAATGGTPQIDANKWAEYEQATFCAYLPRCVTVIDKHPFLSFSKAQMHAHWSNLRHTQTVAEGDDKFLKNRLPENLRMKWDNVVKAAKYQYVREQVKLHASNPAAVKVEDREVLTIDQVITLVRRGDSESNENKKKKKKTTSTTPTTPAKTSAKKSEGKESDDDSDSKSSTGDPALDRPVPPIEEAKSWVHNFANNLKSCGPKGLEDIKKMTEKSLQQCVEEHFGLNKGAMRDHKKKLINHFCLAVAH